MIGEKAAKQCSPVLLLIVSYLLSTPANAELGGENVRFGDLELDLRGRLNQTYDSNIGRTEKDEESDWITKVGIQLSGSKELTEINTINVSIGAEYWKYWRNSEYDSDRNNIILTPNTGLELLIQAGNFDFRVYDDFSMLSDPGDQRFFDSNLGSELTDVVLYNRIQNRVGVDGIWTINPYWDANAGLSRYDVVPLDSDFEDLERYSYEGIVGLTYRLAANLSLNGSVSGSVDRWRTNYQPDSSSWTAGIGADWRVTDVIELNAFIAWTERTFDDDGENGDTTSSSETTTGNFALIHSISPVLDHSIRYFRDLDLGTISNDLTTQSVEYRIDYAGFERSNVYFTVGWYEGVESGNIEPETFDRWAFRSGLGYPLSKQLEFSAFIEHSFRDSNITGRDYSKDLVSVTLEYDF